MTMRRLIAVLAAFCLPGALGASVTAADGVPHLLYEMTIETGMPHLEENLRYAIVKERRCLSRRDLSDAFPMLGDVSLQDCTLVETARTAEAAAYRLQCDGGHGATGQARWQLGPGIISGRLDVRLGGKNMTFHQRITAKPLGGCR